MMNGQDAVEVRMDVQEYPDDSSSLRIMLLGPTGCGKTSTANGILGKDAFPESHTMACQAHRGEVLGRSIWVIDTPGLSESADEMMALQRCQSASDFAPTIFLLLVDVSKDKPDEWLKQHLQWIKRVLPPEKMIRKMVLFTRRETISEGILEFIINNNELQDFIQAYGGVYHSLNSKEKMNRSQVHELLKKIEATMEIRIVLLGKSGSGKSASANTILGREACKADMCSDSVTKICQREEANISGRHVTLVDTPGLLDTQMDESTLKKEIENGVNRCTPGPHAFVLVIRLGRFTDEEKITVNWIQQNFGDEVAKFTIVLFTYADQLRGKPLESIINKDLRALTNSCGGRFCAFNNMGKDPTQVHDLLERIEAMVKRNGGKYYTNEMYQEAQKKLREELERQQQEAETREQNERRINRQIKKQEAIIRNEKERRNAEINGRLSLIRDHLMKKQEGQRQKTEIKIQTIITGLEGIIIEPDNHKEESEILKRFNASQQQKEEVQKLPACQADKAIKNASQPVNKKEQEASDGTSGCTIESCPQQIWTPDQSCEPIPQGNEAIVIESGGTRGKGERDGMQCHSGLQSMTSGEKNRVGPTTKRMPDEAEPEVLAILHKSQQAVTVAKGSKSKELALGEEQQLTGPGQSPKVRPLTFKELFSQDHIKQSIKQLPVLDFPLDPSRDVSILF